MPDIRSLVPHAGTMCLLERIERFDAADVVCSTATHRSPSNPLRRNDRLAALHLAEYGAQAMAVHGGLHDASLATRGGMLVAIRHLALAVDRLDDIEGEIRIHATRLVANPTGLIYAFSAKAGAREIGAGRVSVMLA